MESVLLSLAVLACPVGMGLMMWFMGRGMRKAPSPSPAKPPVRQSVEQLRDEHHRLGAEIERLEVQQANRVLDRS